MPNAPGSGAKGQATPVELAEDVNGESTGGDQLGPFVARHGP